MSSAPRIASIVRFNDADDTLVWYQHMAITKARLCARIEFETDFKLIAISS